MTRNARSKTVREEQEYWTKIFNQELKNYDADTDFTSFWWKKYYLDIATYFSGLLATYKNPHILEAGSGSGKASILLPIKTNITLFDISPSALEYAKVLADKHNIQSINYVKGDIFNMPFNTHTYDMTWNIGVIEHYNNNDVTDMLAEMIRVTKPGGTVAFAIPNYNSGPMLKARLLKLSIFDKVPGYRANTEKRYTAYQLTKLLDEALKISNRTPKSIIVQYFGSPLPMELPKIFHTTLGRFLETLIPKSKFLIFIICTLKN